MRQIVLNEPDVNLRYVYFIVYMIDGITPALYEAGMYPQVNINNTGWQSNDIGPLEDAGYGNYRALLSDNAVGTVGNVILSHYESDHTTESLGEIIYIVQNLSLIPIFDDPTSPSTVLTYLSLPEAEQYFATRLNSDSWIQSKQKDKIAALTMATRDIDQLNFVGKKVDLNQPLAFPRNMASPRPGGPVYVGISGIVYYNNPYSNMPDPLSPPIPIIIFPTQIKFACCEIAYNYLDGIEIETEMNRLLVDNQRYSGGVEETYRSISVNEAKRAGINSNKAWIYLKPYLVDGYQLAMVK
jgi:hypothetical protein